MANAYPHTPLLLHHWGCELGVPKQASLARPVRAPLPHVPAVVTPRDP
jgi:hypothetical protein